MERSGAFNVDHLHREDLLRLMEQVAGMLGQGLTRERDCYMMKTRKLKTLNRKREV